MIYGDYTSIISSLNTGNLPDEISKVVKLVCGKVARKRLPCLVRAAEITTSGSATLNLRTLLPDFFDFKLDVNNDNRFIYSLDASGFPTFYKLVSSTDFINNTQGGVAKKEGNILTLNVGEGGTVPAKIYFPYFSFYCWGDSQTGLPKESPDDNDDTCLITSVFDDVIVDGVLLYISRREKESKEFAKNVQEWEKRVNDIIFYS